MWIFTKIALFVALLWGASTVTSTDTTPVPEIASTSVMAEITIPIKIVNPASRVVSKPAPQSTSTLIQPTQQGTTTELPLVNPNASFMEVHGPAGTPISSPDLLQPNGVAPVVVQYPTCTLVVDYLPKNENGNFTVVDITYDSPESKQNETGYLYPAQTVGGVAPTNINGTDYRVTFSSTGFFLSPATRGTIKLPANSFFKAVFEDGATCYIHAPAPQP